MTESGPPTGSISGAFLCLGESSWRFFPLDHFSNILLLKYKNMLLQERKMWWSSHQEPHSLTYCYNHLFFCTRLIFLFPSLSWASLLENSFASGITGGSGAQQRAVRASAFSLLSRCCSLCSVRSGTPPVYHWNKLRGHELGSSHRWRCHILKPHTARALSACLGRTGRLICNVRCNSHSSLFLTQDPSGGYNVMIMTKHHSTTIAAAQFLTLIFPQTPEKH